MQGTPVRVKQKDDRHFLQPQISKIKAGLHIVFQNGENRLSHTGESRGSIF